MARFRRRGRRSFGRRRSFRGRRKRLSRNYTVPRGGRRM